MAIHPIFLIKDLHFGILGWFGMNQLNPLNPMKLRYSINYVCQYCANAICWNDERS